MLKKAIKYTDYDDNKREETFYFNYSKAELIEMNYGQAGGMQKMLEKIISEVDTVKIMQIFRKLILGAYGEKDPTGKRFIKSEELSEAFSQTEAYSELLLELMGSTDAATAFINGIIPADLRDQLAKEQIKLPV